MNKIVAISAINMRYVAMAAGVLVMALVLFVATTSVSHAAPFLCPVVGDGVLNADASNGDNGVVAITPAVGTSLLPGNNQAGENANENAYNTQGPVEGAGPGHNPDFSPIWPG